MNLRINEFRFLGYNLTHKSKMLPKSLIDGYKFKYYGNPPQRKSLKDFCVEKFKKVIEKLFPNYIAETQNERTTRLWTYMDSNAINALKNGDIPGMHLSKECLEKMAKLDFDNQILYLRQLDKKGRLGKPRIR